MEIENIAKIQNVLFLMKYYRHYGLTAEQAIAEARKILSPIPEEEIRNNEKLKHIVDWLEGRKDA